MKILLIEDNPGDARLIEEMLGEAIDRSAGADESADGDTRALSHADRLSDGAERLEDEPTDVVLLDLGLPDSSGIDTLEAVRDRDRGVPIVVLTGLDDESVGLQAVQRGAQEYLVKDELTAPLLGRSIRHAIERKKFERTQTALHSASRDLIQTESKAEVSQLTVETAVDVLELSGVAVYLMDDSTNELRPVAYTDYIESVFGEVPSFGATDTAITWQAFVTDETITHDDVLEAEHVHRRDTPLRSGIWIPLGDHGVLAIVAEEVGAFDEQTKQLADHLAATAEAALDRVQREASLRENEEAIERRNRQLEDLNRTNQIIREIDQALVDATTQDVIEQAVCERLTRENRYAFAWIGEATDAETLTPRTWAGRGQEYLDAVSMGTDVDEGPPSVVTSSTGTATLTANVAADLRRNPWRKAALAQDLQSALSVPLTYNDLSYGVLTVFASEPDAFDERSKAVFAELGETIANAMNAVETRQTLLTDTVVELELSIRDETDVLGRLARDADCQIEYDGTVPQTDGPVRVFFSVTGAPASAVEDVAETLPRVEALHRLSDDDADVQRFEMTVSGTTVPSTVVECGAVARSITVTDSEILAVVELPDSTDVRTFVDRFEESYPETELLARRDRERSDRSQQAFEAGLTDELTDRQLEVLQTAYHSGYFEWPRERTGEEVAETLGITQPTFNSHLRSAERKLCASLFDESASTTD